MYFPVLSKKANKNNIPMNPWMSKGLLISRRHKILLCSKSLKYPTTNNKNIYTNYRNLYSKIIKAAKKLYFQNKLSNNQLDAKKHGK